MKKLFIGLLAIIFLMPCGITATALHDACKAGNLQEVKRLIGEGAKVDAKDNFGETTLHEAARYGHKQVAEFLLAKSADVNATNENGNTPLYFAAVYGHEKVAQALLVKGAKVDATDENGRTPLRLAASSGYTEVVKFLLDEGADVNATDKYGNTSLHKTAGNGHTEVVQILLNKGAKVDYRNIHGDTPLHCAAKKGREKVVQELTAAPLLLNKSNNANSKLSKETLKKDDDSNDGFVKLFKELPEPALKSVAKSLFPVKDNDEPIIKALLKFSYQDLKENPEQQQSSFAKLFIREFYKNHLLKLKLFIAVQNNDKKTVIDIAWDRNKYTIVNYLEAIQDTQSYDDLEENLRTKTERNYKQLVKYVEAEPMEIE